MQCHSKIMCTHLLNFPLILKHPGVFEFLLYNRNSIPVITYILCVMFDKVTVCLFVLQMPILIIVEE